MGLKRNEEGRKNQRKMELQAGGWWGPPPSSSSLLLKETSKAKKTLLKFLYCYGRTRGKRVLLQPKLFICFFNLIIIIIFKSLILVFLSYKDLLLLFIFYFWGRQKRGSCSYVPSIEEEIIPT